MKAHILGRDRLVVYELGFGCMGLSFGYGPATEKGQRSAFRHFPRGGRATSPASNDP